jgi:FkbM family methyltransferase
MLVDESNKIKYIFSKHLESVYHKCMSEIKINLFDYMAKELIFEHVSEENGYKIVDLTDNCFVTYKNVGLTLKQCPFFEQEHSFYFYKKLVGDLKDKVVFDCGACCGLDAILFAKECKRVYSLEPDSKNFENLMFNTKDYKNIKTVNKALFNHCDTIEFSSENTQGSMILGKGVDIPIEDLKKLRKTDSIKVSCITLDEMLTKYEKPDIIKIDIEGTEYDLIHNDSMKNTLELGPILIFEIHHTVNSKEHFTRLKEYIESFGYKITDHDDQVLGYHILCVKQ